MRIAELLPWHEAAFHHLLSLYRAENFAHAWLLEGPAGGGKRQFARFLAASLLCEQLSETGPCTRCHACHLIAAGSHPDLRDITPQEKSRVIRIEQVRDAVSFMHKTSNQGRFRIVILHPAESMNISAANALLKTLEEPPNGVILLLVSDQPGLVLPTVRSRSRRLALELPAHDIALAWLSGRIGQTDAGHLLAMAEGAPLKALIYDDDSWRQLHRLVQTQLQALLEGKITAIEAAEKLYKEPMDTTLEMLLVAIRDLLRYTQSGGKIALQDSGLSTLAHSLAQGAKSLHSFYLMALEARRALVHNSNPNPRLLLEALFISWRLPD